MAANLTKTVRTIITTRRMERPRGWDRTSIAAFFVGKGNGTWARLPEYGPEALSPEGRARGDVRGWTVPAECFGRDVDQSQVNSLRAYIRDVVFVAMDEAGIAHPAIDRVVTVWDRATGDAIIYRRA